MHDLRKNAGVDIFLTKPKTLPMIRNTDSINPIQVIDTGRDRESYIHFSKRI